jgi:hypothetical protein
MQVLGANDLMTIDTASNDESLDRALVKCLRLFAKHGRKIRGQKSLSDEKPSGCIKIEKENQSPKDQESSQRLD